MQLPQPFMTPVLVVLVRVNAARVIVLAGFYHPAENHSIEHIKLISTMVKHPQATFYVCIQGDSVRDASRRSTASTPI